MTENYLQMMIDSLHMKKNLLTGIVELNTNQVAMADEKNSEFDEQKFYANVEEKGELVEQLLKLDDGFDALYVRVKELLEQNKAQYASEIAQMQNLIKEITDLSVQAQAQEARNKILVEKRFRMMKQNIQNAKRSTRMANVYYQRQNQLDNQPQFMDQKK